MVGSRLAMPLRRSLAAAALVSGVTVAVVPIDHSTATAHNIGGCQSVQPVTAYRAGGIAVAPTPVSRKAFACAFATGYPTSETTIAVTNAQTLILSPSQSENTLARSSDRGAHWNLIYPLHVQLTSFWNTVDPDVVTDRRTGRVFWVRATGPVNNEDSLPAGAGFYLTMPVGFQVFRSSDNGQTFAHSDNFTAPTSDWEKIFVGPAPPASSGAAQPSGYPDVVYVCANAPLQAAGPTRLCYKSLDGGASFTYGGLVAPSIAGHVCPPLNFNAGAVDSQGTVFQPVSCLDGAYVATSHDEGSTYTSLHIGNAPAGSVLGGNNLKIAVDAADTLYVTWSDHGMLYLEISRDHGATWSLPLMISAPGVKGVGLLAVAAGAAGHVAVTYYGSTNPTATTLSAYITETSDALRTSPVFYEGALNNPSQPIFHDYGFTDSPRADFIGGAYDSVGTTFWAGVVKQLGPPDANAYIPTTGWVGRLELIS